MEEILRYFPNLSDRQKQQFESLAGLYQEWNARINVISRRDMDFFYPHHVLHSLGIAKVQEFLPGTQILDVGTGGGFPAVPLAILFPEVKFTAVDSIGKKIRVVENISQALELKNLTAINARVENIEGEFDFIVSRAVAAMPEFVGWVRSKIAKKSLHSRRNGILYLKGGDLSLELKNYPTAQIFPLSDYFESEFFQTKKVVYLPLKKQ